MPLFYFNAVSRSCAFFHQSSEALAVRVKNGGEGLGDEGESSFWKPTVYSLFGFSAPSAFPPPPPWEPWHCPGPSYLARGRATEKGRVYFLFLWIIYQYNSPLCCLATAEWRVSFIIRTERGCGKRDLNSSGSVWTLLSGESLNGGVFQQGYE